MTGAVATGLTRGGADAEHTEILWLGNSEHIQLRQHDVGVDIRHGLKEPAQLLELVAVGHRGTLTPLTHCADPEEATGLNLLHPPSHSHGTPTSRLEK